MATAQTSAPMTPGFLATERRDAWWVQPAVTFVVLTAFVVYATFRVFENAHYSATQGGLEYHTPFGSPDLTFITAGWRDAIPFLGAFLAYPAVLILPFVAGFRFTCYYYRKAYYRSFAMRPAACSVGASTGLGYKGERGILVFQNLHRYFLYAALVVLSFNAYDMVVGFFTPEHGGWGAGFHLGLGNLVMVLNVAFLSAYTLGCHSFRHLVGGKLDCFSCSAVAHVRHGVWSRVTMLNERHQLWAWTSLVWVALTDLYIRHLASTGSTHILGIPA